MRIQSNQVSSNQIDLEQSSSSKLSQTSSSASSANVQDHASLTNDSATVSALQQQAMAAPDVRQDKVDALKQQIASGEYKVDPGEVAKSMRENGL
jgi:negative regulator of flagellin synthesis FlgM